MKKAELFFTSVLVPVDFLALVAAGIAAFYSRFHPFFTSIRPVIFDLTMARFLPIVFGVALVWIVIFAFVGLYNTTRTRLWNELGKVFFACLCGVAVVLGGLFFSRELFESRFIVLAGFAFAFLFVGTERLLIRALQRSLLRAGIGVHHVALIGKNKTADAIHQGFRQRPSLGFVVVAQFDRWNDTAQAKLLTLKKQGELDEIILVDADAGRKVAETIQFFADVHHLTFKYSADLFATATSRTETHMYAGIPVIEVRKTPLDGWGAIYKRIFDVIVSLILIIITLPIQLLIVIALFIEQPGRVLFSRLPNGKKVERIGEEGRPFHYFKFRSMIKDAHKYRYDPVFIKQHGNLREGTPLFKLKEDPRVTPVGKIIRKYSLDELPEFYLVLLGRMSLVGPRPHLPEEVEAYKPAQRKVLTIKPGITGVPQTSGRADLDFDEEVRLDLYYIEHWSPFLDLYVLLKTPLVVLFRKGAY